MRKIDLSPYRYETRTERAARTRRDPRRRILVYSSYALFAAALILGTQPWWSGVQTWFGQRRLHREAPKVEASTPPRSASATRPVVPFSNWENEDAAYWRELKDGGFFGQLSIPKAEVDIAVVKGVSKEDLKIGPGWIPDTNMPGPTGNCAISGHRTTYLHPFKHIDRLKAGDEITFKSPYREYKYRVLRQVVVSPKQVEVIEPTPQSTLTLTACHPPYSAKYRLVVQAQLVSVTRLTKNR